MSRNQTIIKFIIKNYILSFWLFTFCYCFPTVSTFSELSFHLFISSKKIVSCFLVLSEKLCYETLLKKIQILKPLTIIRRMTILHKKMLVISIKHVSICLNQVRSFVSSMNICFWYWVGLCMCVCVELFRNTVTVSRSRKLNRRTQDVATIQK